MTIHQLMKLMKIHVKPICGLNENNEDGNNMACVLYVWMWWIKWMIIFVCIRHEKKWQWCSKEQSHDGIMCSSRQHSLLSCVERQLTYCCNLFKMCKHSLLHILEWGNQTKCIHHNTNFNYNKLVQYSFQKTKALKDLLISAIIKKLKIIASKFDNGNWWWMIIWCLYNIIILVTYPLNKQVKEPFSSIPIEIFLYFNSWRSTLVKITYNHVVVVDVVIIDVLA